MPTVNQIITDNIVEIRALMRWENYGLNETVIPIMDKLKDDAIMMLRKNYGGYEMYDDEVQAFLSDIFTYFVVLTQELSITRLIDAYAVATHDEDTERITSTSAATDTDNSSETLSAGTSVSESVSGETTDTSAGKVTDTGKQTSEGTSASDITNTSDIDETGSHGVNLTHTMPEQAIDTVTKKLPVDSQGTPKLSASTIQGAGENFSTTNPMKTEEKSEQKSENAGTVDSENVSETESETKGKSTSTRTASNSGSDITSRNSSSVNTTNDESFRELHATNKQYAYEVSAFIKTAGEVVAFQNWVNNFSWIGGIL